MAKILPKYKIEVSFTASNTASLSFTDITTDVRLDPGVTITVGRTDQFSAVQASTASFTVDNLTGTYTPGQGNVTRGRAVRISATEDNPAAYTQIYYGFVDTITQAWDNTTGKMSNVVFTCVDLSTLLGRRSLTDTILDYYATVAATPEDWWPLDDAVGTLSPANKVGITRVVPVILGAGAGGVTYQTDGIPYGTGGQHSAQIVESALNTSNLTTLYDFTTGWTIGCFFQIPTGTTATTIDLITLADATFTNFASLLLQSDGSVEMSINSGSVVAFLQTGSHQVDDGEWHHAAIVFDPSTGGHASLIVDAGDITGGTVSGIGSTSPALPIFYIAQLLGLGGTVNMQHVMAWQSALSFQAVHDIAHAGLTGFSGETSSARVQRIAGVAGYTPTIVGSAGITSMAPWNDFTSSIWDMLAAVAATEQGILYVDRTGAITFRTRLSLFNQTAALTFGSGTYEDSLQFIHSASNFFNSYTATAFNSTNPQAVTNASSVTNDGLWNDSATVDTTLDVEALSYAQTLVTTTGIPLTRLPQLDVDMLTQQTLFAGLLAAFWTLDLGDLITVSSLPTQAVASSVSLFLQGFTHTLTDSSYDATLNLADGQKNAWILQDATYGLLGSTTILA